MLDDYCAFLEEWEREHGTRTRSISIKPALFLFNDEPKSKQYRKRVAELIAQRDSDGKHAFSAADVIRRAAETHLLPQTLDAPPGTVWHPFSKEYLLREEAERRIAAWAVARASETDHLAGEGPQAAAAMLGDT